MKKYLKPLQTIRARIILLLVATVLFFIVFYSSITHYFTSSIKNSIQTLTSNSFHTVSELTEGAFLKKEEAAISNLMDEKAYRVNMLLNDLERMVELESFFVSNLLASNKKSHDKIFEPSDFLNNPQIKKGLIDHPKYVVAESLEYPDLMLRDQSNYQTYSYIYKELRPILKNLYTQYQHVLWTYIGFDGDGSFLNYPGTYADPPDYDPRKRPWYISAKLSNEIIWEEPYYDSGQGKLVLTVAKAIYHPTTQKFFAVVGTDLLLKNFIEDIVDDKNNYNMIYLVLDDAGKILYKKGDETIFGEWKDKRKDTHLTTYLKNIEMNAYNAVPPNGHGELMLGQDTFYVYKRKLDRVGWTVVGLLEKSKTLAAYHETLIGLNEATKNTQNKIAYYVNLHYVLIGFLIVFGGIVLFVSYRILKAVFVVPFSRLVAFIENLEMTSRFDDVVSGFHEKNEIGIVTKALVDYRKRVLDYQNKIEKSVEFQAIATTARQVAHDIRSPLTSLKIATAELKEVPEEERLIIRSAVQRIEDIANDLSNRRLKAQGVGHKEGDGERAHELTSLRTHETYPQGHK